MKSRPTAPLLQICAVLVALGMCTKPVRAESTGAPYAQELTRRADELELHTQPQWLALLHYRARLLRGRRSLASTARFFASPEGAFDPRAELEATIASFFEATPREGEDISRRCAYPARYQWLDRQLGFDASKMPVVPCPHFERWLAETAGPRLSLIFPEAFMNNPASMFGHTLLRVARQERAEDAAEGLLGYALDYSGNVGGDGVLFQIFGGVFGLYPGSFGVNPYYEKLKKYAEWEYRDVWEYDLDFSPAEIEFLLRHVWELRGISFPYYFFDDNCSYQLLRLLQVVRPHSKIDGGFPLHVLPADTVRVLVAAGFTGEVRYRASPATRLRQGARELSRPARRLARKIATGATPPSAEKLAALPPRERAIVLSVAYESLRYDFLSGDATAAGTRSRARALLLARSRLGREFRGDPLADLVGAPSVRPDRGHASARASLAGGVRDGKGYLELRIRAALHDLMDPAGGYSRESQIQVLDTRVRYFPGRQHVRLEQLTLLDIVSLSPRNAFFRQLAWKTSTGLRTRWVRTLKSSGSSQLDPKPVWNTNAGLGWAISPLPGVVGYGFGELTLDVGPGLDDSVSFGPGATLGVYADGFGDRYRANLEGSVLRFAAGHVASRYRAGVRQRLTLSRRSAVVAVAGWNRSEGESWLEGSLSVHFYF